MNRSEEFVNPCGVTACSRPEVQSRDLHVVQRGSLAVSSGVRQLQPCVSGGLAIFFLVVVVNSGIVLGGKILSISD